MNLTLRKTENNSTENKSDQRNLVKHDNKNKENEKHSKTEESSKTEENFEGNNSIRF